MKTLVPTILLFFCLPTTTAAWNDLGHMIVAASAYDQLTPEAREKVSTLLKLNPNYGKWVAHVPKQEMDRVAFVRASRWPDDIKVDPAYKQDGRHNGNRPSGRKAAQNIGYTDKLQHKYWHFINLPFSPDNTRLVDPPTPNAKTQIALFRKTLQSPTSGNYLKSYDLVWLMHLVADVHQPLHATSRFDKAHKKGDDGGNGNIVIQSPISPASGKIIPLGQKPLITTTLLSQRCAALAGGNASSFTVAGRDALPAEPGGWVPTPLALAALSGGTGQEEREGEVLSGLAEPSILSLRKIAPPGFLTQSFAVDSSAGCAS